MAKIMEKAILGVLLVMVLGIGSVLVTAVATNTNPLEWVSSIRVAEDSGLSEAEESIQLAPLAKITSDEAKSIAINAVDISKTGQVKEVQIENENGNVVYDVEFSNNGIETDVKIDAGNGKVLLIEDDNNEADVEDKDGTDLEEDSEDKNGFDDFEQDGIDHEFEGDEGDHED